MAQDQGDCGGTSLAQRGRHHPRGVSETRGFDADREFSQCGTGARLENRVYRFDEGTGRTTEHPLKPHPGGHRRSGGFFEFAPPGDHGDRDPIDFSRKRPDFTRLASKRDREASSQFRK